MFVIVDFLLGNAENFDVFVAIWNRIKPMLCILKRTINEKHRGIAWMNDDSIPIFVEFDWVVRSSAVNVESANKPS